MRIVASPSAAMLFALLGIAGCSERPTGSIDGAVAENPSCDEAGVRTVVQQFGDRLKQVSLLGPDSVVVREIRDAYAELVDPQLLEDWSDDPSNAPGRTTSSPWPDRIEIARIDSVSPAACRVEGVIVYETSTEVERGGTAVHDSVALRVERSDGWRIHAYRTRAPRDGGTEGPTADLTSVIRRYYEALNAGDFRRAYEMWGGRGSATGQSFEEYRAFFDGMRRLEVETGMPGRIEPAAGSRYVEIPVMLRITHDDGRVETREGTYTLRQSVVDSSTPAQRNWHIYSADIETPSE
ncbi:MAG TPA: hypothetical protein VF190_03060 [Rhodothermales bacterium]